MTKDFNTDLQLDQHLRYVLQAVANTVAAEEGTAPTGRPNSRPAPPPASHRPVIGAAAIPVALAAGAILKSGPECVDQIPRESIIVEGTVGGSELPAGGDTPNGSVVKPARGVELVEEN